LLATDLDTSKKFGKSDFMDSNFLSFTKVTVIISIRIAVKPAIIPKYINPIDSCPPPKNNTIGNPSADIEKVPKAAANILDPVRIVLSSLSSVIRAVKEE
jgi:hypothetical protein